MTKPVRLPVLVLAIQTIHAERIFSGEKLFELRKLLPRTLFHCVFLYETGGGGIIGYFECGEPICLPVDELWKKVGPSATPRERFFKYFSACESGWAIPVIRSRRFRKCIPLSTLRREHGFRPPMSYRLVESDSKLYDMLQTQREAADKERTVELKPITRADHEMFIALVTEEIAPKYYDISEAFARAILRTHRLGKDPNGIFTIAKKIYAVRTEARKRIGFTTLTFKVGGCLKTGPTILLKRFRRQGYGLAVRKAIQQLAKNYGIRKLYCTCPDNDPPLLQHLIGAGFMVEAHLRAHYSSTHGEIVLGNAICLSPGVPPFEILRPSTGVEPKVLEVICPLEAAKLLRGTLAQFWGLTSDMIAERIVGGSKVAKTEYEEKPSRVIFFGSRESIAGIAILVPKRGGSLKVLWFPLGPPCCFGSMIDQIGIIAREWCKRKVYFIHPVEDLAAINSLRQRMYRVEGLLQEPYCAGRDGLLLAKFL